MSAQPPRYSEELRESAVRMVAEVRPKYSSEWAAISAVANELGIRHPETLRRWVRQAESSSSKWLFLKKSLLRPHPIVIGVIITVLGGLALAYSQLALGVNKHKPSLVVDDVSLSPGGVVVSQNGHSRMRFFKIDIKLLNTGTQVAAINDARLVIQKFVKLPQCATEGDFGSTGRYHSNMPTDARPGTVIRIPVSQLVNPDGADRFDLLLDTPIKQSSGLLTIYLYWVHVYLDYNTGTSPVDIGEILIALPFDPPDGNGYFWTHLFATHPHYLDFEGTAAFGIEKCLIRNSHTLNTMLSLPGKRTTTMSKIPPLLAFCCARRNSS
jgi:hypothetical protein